MGEGKRGLCRSFRLLLVQLLLAAAAALPCLAEDKNGVAPNTISLPSGPGSIEGLGESFQPMLNTGTARYGVPLALPAGVSGHTPSLSLRYESGHGDGPAGIGWSFGPGSVSRQTDKGIPRYVDGPNGVDDDHDGEIDEPDEVDRFIGLEEEELAQLADGTYRARIEGTFIRYRRVGDHWEAHLKDGTKLEFGLTPGARVTDPAGSRVFRWLLERSTDTNDNVIEFDYTSFPGSDNQKYLKEIRYGPGASPWAAFYFVALSYEERPDWRKDYRSGFLIKTGRRLQEVQVGIQGVLPDQCAEGDWNGDGTPDALIRRYALSYEESYTRFSLLSSVTRFASDGVSYLPPVSFSYSPFSPDESTSAAGAILSSSSAPPTVMDSELVELIDLNRDGLPDILQTDLYGTGHRYYANLGVSGDGGGAEIEWDEGRDVGSPDGLALGLHLVDDEVHLADMDGDGISDLIHTPYSQEVSYYLNGGDGLWGERRRMSVQDTPPPAPFAHADVETADLDFDKRMDVVQSTETGYTVWFNLEGGRYSRRVNTAGAVHRGELLRFSYAGVHLEDLNGDRLTDVARIRTTQVVYAAGMGHGRFAPAVEIPIPDTVLTDGTGGQVERARLKDINGDGLADLVVERARANQLWYWLNLGTDSFSHKHVVTDMPTVLSPGTATRWADLNGNGTTDLVYADSHAVSRLMTLDIGELVGGSAHPNLLTGIDNGLGVRTEILYRSSTAYCVEAREEGHPWSTTIPFPVQVVAEVRTTTGLDLDGVPGEDQYLKTFRYRDGFYEDRRKAFRGFAEVVVAHQGDATAPTSVTTHGFFTGGPDGVDNDGDDQVDEILEPWWHREEDALKGLVRSVSVATEAGVLFSEETNHWHVRNLAVSPDQIEVRFAYNETTEQRIFEGTATPETLQTTYVHDDFGNVTEERNHGALSIAGDEAFAFTEYINDTNVWILGLPQRQLITDEAGQRFAETLSYYDGPDYVGLPLGQVSRGDLTRQEGWVEGNQYVDRVRSAYDIYGNIVGIRDGNGNRRTVTYDPALHAFPVQEQIEVGGGSPDLALTAAYNLGLGVVTSSVDFNGHPTVYGHDRFGRLTSIVRPGDSAALPTLTFAYTLTNPERGLTYAYDAAGALTLTQGPAGPSSVETRAREVSGQGGTFDTVQYVDGMGRKLALLEEGETGFIVEGAALFDAKGSVRFSFLPYETGVSAYQPPDPTNIGKTETHYDAAGRAVLAIHPPDEHGVLDEARTQHLPLAKTVTDENGIPKTFYSDGLERLAEVQEQNGGETYVTQYGYDPLGNLRSITDAQSNLKTFAYDGLSRRTLLDDPDRGRMAYSYDAAGNLVQTVDNKGQVIAYTHDRANRVLTEDYLDAAGITPDIAFFYDAPSTDHPTATNTVGRLSWVEDLSGGEFFSYDDRGNTDFVVKRIRSDDSHQDFRTSFSHDAMGRVVSMVYPDGEALSYAYNRRTLLDAIPGFVDGIDHTASGQIASIAYANGVSTSYAYDPRQRLTDLHTVSAFQGGEVVQDLAYGMDGVSNITAITDGRSLPPGSPKDANQSFAYDDLYRLTSAEGPGYGAIDFQYDRIGNLTFKSSPDLPDPRHIDDALVNLGIVSYGGAAGTSGRGPRLPGDAPGPHAVTSTESGLAYGYDDNGNMVDHAGDVYEWDFKDRLMRVQKGAADSNYAYDYGGQRVVKKVNEGGTEKTTLYVSKAFEIREGSTVKYVFSGSRRIARVETEPPETGPAQQSLSFEPGWNFFSLRVEPDDPAVAAVLAPISGSYTEVWEYDPLTQQYLGYVPSQSVTDLSELHAQKGYLLRATSAATLNVSGTSATADIGLARGWNLVASPAAGAIPVRDAFASIAGRYDVAWVHDNVTGGWQCRMPGELAFLSDLDTVEPGKAYWIRASSAAQLSRQLRTTHFFHPDHLGSSNAVTDAGGAVVESTEFYPYGRPRHEERAGFDSAYKYTGKELDRESGLMYYEARYYEPVTGRFVSVDPMFLTAASQWLAVPQSLNAYAYSQNNPIKYIDPDGRIIKLASDLGERQQTVKAWLEKLTGRTITIGTTGKIEMGWFGNPFRKSKGRSLVRQLMEAEKEIQIGKGEPYLGGRNANQQGRGFQFTRGLGQAGPTISVVFENVPKLRTKAANGSTLTSVSGPVALGHELIHAYRDIKGLYRDPLASKYWEDAEELPAEEAYTVGLRQDPKYAEQKIEEITEHMLEKEQGQPERAKYRPGEIVLAPLAN